MQVRQRRELASYPGTGNEPGTKLGGSVGWGERNRILQHA